MRVPFKQRQFFFHVQKIKEKQYRGIYFQQQARQLIDASLMAHCAVGLNRLQLFESVNNETGGMLVRGLRAIFQGLFVYFFPHGSYYTCAVSNFLF